jgi:hypothetical protein
MAKRGETLKSEGGSELYLVETPVENYNGTVAGVQFAYGKAEVHDGWVLEWFRESGYKVTKK